MEQVKILATTGVGNEISRDCLDLIQKVSPRVRLLNDGAADLSGESGAAADLDSLMSQAEILYGFRVPKDIITRAPGLKWIQLMTAGVDWYLNNVSGLREGPVMLTNNSGVHAVAIGEFVLGAMLMCAKQAPFCFSLKQEKTWRRFDPRILRGATVGIVGLGDIGREVARLASAFRMHVIGIRRSNMVPVRYVDEVLPRGRLLELLSRSDYVVLALPYTPETKSLIGAREFAAMKPAAYLINIARGGIVDEAAMISALEQKKIAGVALDVFVNEPPADDSKLWTLPNVIFSPHVAGNMDNYNLLTTELFCKNLRRYLKGKPLMNVVNKKTGY
ncbi:MAG: D-2-hydroxyacid dehydrogenase [Dehalococcoidales bacterium]|nr:D-2-hydroxyacid dehydrogenase [Dehalococcoidales bacterium]